MALASELRVSQAIRSSGFCGRCTAAPRSCPGKAGSGSLLVFAQGCLLTLRERGRTTLQDQQRGCYESDEYENALHSSLPYFNFERHSHFGDALLRKLTSRAQVSKTCEVASTKVDRCQRPAQPRYAPRVVSNQQLRDIQSVARDTKGRRTRP